MEEIKWPWQYSFPPFFTPQPHKETKSRQMAIWTHLILDYHKCNKKYILDVSEARRSPLFYNESINRKLEPEFIVELLRELERTGNAAPCDKTNQRWEIYWHTLSEWADIIYKWANENDMKTVCTLYELTQGDDTVNEEFHGLDKDILIKALRVLEGDKKCELILFDDNEGVKFF